MKKIFGIIIAVVLIATAGTLGYKSLNKTKAPVEKNQIISDNENSQEKKEEETKSTEETQKSNDTNNVSKEKTDLDEKNKKIDGANAKDNLASAEELITSYKVILESLVNNKNSDMRHLEEVANKDTDFYKQAKGEIDNYRKKGYKFSSIDFDIKDIKYNETDGLYEADVKEYRNIEGSSKTEERNGIYKVKIDGESPSIIKYQNK